MPYVSVEQGISAVERPTLTREDRGLSPTAAVSKRAISFTPLTLPLNEYLAICIESNDGNIVAAWLGQSVMPSEQRMLEDRGINLMLLIMPRHTVHSHQNHVTTANLLI